MRARSASSAGAAGRVVGSRGIVVHCGEAMSLRDGAGMLIYETG
jgi:hypothetical protein